MDVILDLIFIILTRPFLQIINVDGLILITKMLIPLYSLISSKHIILNTQS